MGRTFFAIVVSAAASLAVATAASPAETNSATVADDQVLGRQVAQSYKDLQDQQQATLRAVEQARQEAAAQALAIEKARLEAEAAAQRNLNLLQDRLKQIEDGVSAQRERERESLQKSHRFTLILVGVFAGMGIFGMLFLAVFLVRLVNRRSTALVPSAGFGEPGGGLVTLDPAQQSSARFLSTIERLEKRVHELEATTHEPEVLPGDTESQPVANNHAEVGLAARVALLLGKGQALLNLQQADTALACFDEVVGLDATNAEAFVRKGSALEKLGRLDEAIDCYDRAIALDNSMTMAYLSKGGVFNRLERYSEALQCYEQALRAQQKAGVA